MMKRVHADVTVIGGGPGGYVAAIRASQLEAEVVLVEKDKLGGTCINKGCIPTKALIKTGEAISESKQLKAYDIRVDLSKLDFAKIMKEANSIAAEVCKHVEALMKRNDIMVIKGIGKLVDHRTVEVEGDKGDRKVIESSAIIVATGSSPLIPPIPGLDDRRIFTSDDMFNYYERPERVAVIGAGAVGLEWGSIWNSFGSNVTIIEMMPQILPREDEEMVNYLKEILEEKGISIITGSRVNRITSAKDELTLHLEGEKDVKGDVALVAVGRIPNSKEIGLDGLVDLDNGRIVVDNHMRTKTENIYAIGDVVGRYMLAHVAIQEGLVAGENAVGGDVAVRYEAVPRCVYTDPEAAFLGLSEKEARRQTENVETSFYPLRANGRAMTMNKIKGGIKLIYEKKFGELLGAQIIAPQASELIGELCVAMQAQATLEDIANTVHAHPTLSEIIRENALRGLGRDLHI